MNEVGDTLPISIVPFFVAGGPEPPEGGGLGQAQTVPLAPKP